MVCFSNDLRLTLERLINVDLFDTSIAECREPISDVRHSVMTNRRRSNQLSSIAGWVNSGGNSVEFGVGRQSQRCSVPVYFAARDACCWESILIRCPLGEVVTCGCRMSVKVSIRCKGVVLCNNNALHDVVNGRGKMISIGSYVRVLSKWSFKSTRGSGVLT